MNIELITELPAWWMLVCMLAGGLYAFILYRKDHSLDSVHPWLRRLLFGLRAMLVFLLAIFLLTPLLKSFVTEQEKPVIIIAQDNSQSIVLGKDSAKYRGEYRSKLDKIQSELKEKFDVRTVSWGDKVSDNISYAFNEKQTDFSSLMDELNVRYGNRNVGAVIVATDGLYNRGSSPLYSGAALKVPVYPIALGDTTIRKDLFISRINFNKIVYLGNSFPVQVNVSARQSSGAKTILTISEDSSVIFSREINITSNTFEQTIPAVFEAKKTGNIHYKVKLSTIVDEATVLNNEKDIFFEVAESRQKILLLADAPHPDIGALKNAIESSRNYTFTSTMFRQFQGGVKEYNLVIFHNLPSAGQSINQTVQRCREEGVPMLFIVGSKTVVSEFNNLKTGITISENVDKSNYVNARLTNDFSLFTLSDEIRNLIPKLPALLNPFGRYRSTADNTILLYQQIGNVATEQPLQVFNESGGVKSGVICGEGLWRWRLTDYSVNGNFNSFQEWITKTVQNLSVKESRKPFRLIRKNNYQENEPVVFEAEVYNENYELINSPDVNITITNPAGKSFPFTFSKTDRSYNLNAGYWAAGDYKFNASVKVGGKVYSESGRFSVAALQAEQSETVADHQLLQSLASKTGGEVVYPADMEKLVKLLNDRKDLKTISYTHYKLRDLVDVKLVFFILLSLLTLEWFLRKRAGSY